MSIGTVSKVGVSTTTTVLMSGFGTTDQRHRNYNPYLSRFFIYQTHLTACKSLQSYQEIEIHVVVVTMKNMAIHIQQGLMQWIGKMVKFMPFSLLTGT